LFYLFGYALISNNLYMVISGTLSYSLTVQSYARQEKYVDQL